MSWHTGETREACLESCTFRGCSGCPDPIRISFSSSPEVIYDYETYQQEGAYPAGPILTDTTFTLRLRDDDDDISTVEHSVHVVLPDEETITDGTFQGTCSGTYPAWTAVDLSAGVFRSELVRLVKVCNLNRFPVDLIVFFETTSEHYVLSTSDCTREFEPSLGVKIVNAQAYPLGLALSSEAECTATRSRPPEDLQLTFFLICDSESRSRSVVAGEPEPTSTPIELIWETPTSTPEIVPSQPMATFVRNANCRLGPGTVYDVMTSLFEGQEVRIEGQSASEPKWWWILLPDSSAHCWVSDSTVQTLGPTADLEIIAAPPTPTSSPTSVQGCLHQGPNDNQPLCYVPCPPNPNPGGACTP